MTLWYPCSRRTNRWSLFKSCCLAVALMASASLLVHSQSLPLICSGQILIFEPSSLSSVTAGMMDPQRLASLLDQAFPPRALARRKIEMFWHDLLRLEQTKVRLRIVMEGTAGEAAVAQRILDMERDLIVCQGRKGSYSTRSSMRSESIVQEAYRRNDIPTILSVLSGAGCHSLQNLYNLPLQMLCIEALHRLCHKNPLNRSRLVNCGGIAALLTSTRIHAACEAFLHHATALIISLPFYKDGHAFADRMGIVQPHAELHGVPIKRRKLDDDTMDASIASLLIHTINDQDPGEESSHIFALIADSVDLDLFHVKLNQPGDENGNYERLLAVKQIPVVCRGLDMLVNDPPRMRRRLLFLRTCLASYLGDTSITTDTLGAIVL